MAEIGASIKLRPTRIGFLVRPNDMTSIRKIMRICTCIWGGIYNPIIPVFQRPPSEWNLKPYTTRLKGIDVAKGYINFYEPDVYVESEHGLLEELGLGALREKHTINSSIISLDDFLKPEDGKDWSEPFFGLNILDVYKDLYDTEHRFKLKHERAAVLIKEENGSGLAQAVFGVYPKSKDSDYIKEGFVDVFSPKILKATPESWLEVFKNGAETPLQLTKHKLNIERYWNHDLVIYVFDPKRSTDLIDLWNLRLEPNPILPVPIEWFKQLSEFLSEVIIEEFRPLRGNSHGVTHHATIEFGRSIETNIREEALKHLKKFPEGALSVKHWRNSVWEEHDDDRIYKNKRMKVTAEEQQVTLDLKEDTKWTTTFEAITPKFAERYGGHNFRWVNTLMLSGFGIEAIARVIPFNHFDRSWPRLGFGDKVIVGSEGWVFGQKYKNTREYVSLINMEEAVIGSLKASGIDAKLSDPGHVAKQMLESLNGLRGVSLIAHLDTIKLINNMANSLRRKSNEIDSTEETFERRSATRKQWTDLISKRNTKISLRNTNLEAFTKSNIIKLGLETQCPNCQAHNWHTLTAVDYKITCERCLKVYDFPQASLREHNGNWFYRVVGPFSVPDYAQGSYSVLLTLRALQSLGSSMDEMTFSTALELHFDGMDAEADFVVWRRKENHDFHKKPDLLIGEAKSFGIGDLIKPKDLVKLKQIGKKLPGAFIVISVLRGHYTESEIRILKSFVKWCRRFNSNGLPTNPLILLTSNELFFDFQISETWENLGKAYKPFTDYEHSGNLSRFADATQQIYLGIESFYEWRNKEYKKKRVKKQNLDQ